jgi:hypothetical protein
MEQVQMHTGYPRRCLKALLFAAVSLSLTAQTQVLAAGNPASSPVNWTAVMMSPTISPRPVKGSDGRTYILYELLLSNMSPYPARLNQLQVLNGDNPEKVVKQFDEKEMLPVFDRIGVKKKAAGNPSALIPPGTNAMIWVSLSFAGSEEIPHKLLHKLTFESRNKENKPENYTNTSASVNVDERAPLVVSSPLKGKGWVAGNAFTALQGHRRAVMPIDNKLNCAQRFAIDYVRLDKDNKSCTGDHTLVTSYPAYGEPVLAVADGKVAGVVQGFKDQPMGVASGDRNFPGGNSVTIDLGDGNYAFYAHLKPGSIKVHEGEQVKRGQELALLGNAGNSDGPHLHFHITEGPAILGSNGIPYVIDSFKVEGEIADRDKFDKEEEAYKGHELKQTMPADKQHEKELPRNMEVVSFP